MQTLKPDGLVSNPGLTLVSCRILDISIFLYFSLFSCKMDIKPIATSLGCGSYVASGLSSILRFLFHFLCMHVPDELSLPSQHLVSSLSTALAVRTCIICITQDPKALSSFLFLVPCSPLPPAFNQWLTLFEYNLSSSLSPSHKSHMGDINELWDMFYTRGPMSFSHSPSNMAHIFAWPPSLPGPISPLLCLLKTLLLNTFTQFISPVSASEEANLRQFIWLTTYR